MRSLGEWTTNEKEDYCVWYLRSRGCFSWGSNI